MISFFESKIMNFLCLIFIFQLNDIETQLMELDEQYNNDQITLAAYASKNRSLQEWDRNNQKYSSTLEQLSVSFLNGTQRRGGPRSIQLNSRSLIRERGNFEVVFVIKSPSKGVTVELFFLAPIWTN